MKRRHPSGDFEFNSVAAIISVWARARALQKERCRDLRQGFGIEVRCCVGTGDIFTSAYRRGLCYLKAGKKKCQAERLADYEANVILLQEKAIVCQVIICVEENNPRFGVIQIGISVIRRAFLGSTGIPACAASCQVLGVARRGNRCRVVLTSAGARARDPRGICDMPCPAKELGGIGPFVEGAVYVPPASGRRF